MLLPGCTKSKTDMLLPDLPVPKTEMLDPSLENVRIDNELAKFVKFNTERLLPVRICE
jgi:hypothetical protein